MRLKSYFAESIEAAMEKARVELGAEAMLISSHETSRDLKDLGAYEVVFGLAPADVAPAGLPVATADSALYPAEKILQQETVLKELAELRRQLESLTQSVGRSAVTRAAEKFTPDLSRQFDRLLNAGFSPELAQELIEAVAGRLRSSADSAQRVMRDHRDPFARDLFEAVLREQIESRFGVAPSLGGGTGSPAATALVGIPGAGKTTSLVKLGLEFGVKARRPLHFWSLDTLRVGGCDQLSKYARLSGAEFRALTDHAALANALSRASSDDLILIDTPGFAAADTAELHELARGLRSLPVEVQLVFPASMNLEAAQKAARRFAAFEPSKLLLTHMDESVTRACAVEFAARVQLPLSFFGTGQQIPEDIVAADKATLLRALVPLEQAASVAA